MSLTDKLLENIPELAFTQRDDTFLTYAKDVNEKERGTPGGINDVTLVLLGPISDDALKERIEKYIRSIRPSVKRILYYY